MGLQGLFDSLGRHSGNDREADRLRFKKIWYRSAWEELFVMVLASESETQVDDWVYHSSSKYPSMEDKWERKV